VRTPGGLFWGVWYAGGIDFRLFCTADPTVFGEFLDLLEAMQMTYKS